MARKGRKGARNYDVEDLVELVGALSNIRNGNSAAHGGPPLTDPSINVKEQLTTVVAGLRSEAEMTSKYEEKIRVIENNWQQRLDGANNESRIARELAESRRIDANVSTQQQAVVIASKEAVAAAAALATQVAATAQTTATAITNLSETMGKRLSAVEQNQWQTGGGESQRRESLTDTRWTERQKSQRSEWMIGLLIGAGLTLGGLVLAVSNFLSNHLK